MAATALAVGGVAGSVLWSLPILAAGLVALLRYSFGSLFVVGESVAALLLSSAGGDIAGSLQRLQTHPLAGVGQAGLGLAGALGAAGLAFRHLAAGSLLAGASAAWAWECGMAAAGWVLLAGCAAGLAGWVAARP